MTPARGTETRFLVEMDDPESHFHIYHTSSHVLCGEQKIAPQLKNEYKLNICWIQLFTDIFFSSKRKKIMEKNGLDLSRNQNWLLLLVNAIESRLPEAQAETCILISSYTWGSRFLFLLSFYLLLTFLLLSALSHSFIRHRRIGKHKWKNDRGNGGCDGGGADLWRCSSVSVCARSLGVYLTLSCLEQSRYRPKSVPIMLCLATPAHRHADSESVRGCGLAAQETGENLRYSNATSAWWCWRWKQTDVQQDRPLKATAASEQLF